MVTGYPFGSNSPRFNYPGRGFWPDSQSGNVKPWTNPDTGQVIRNFPQQNPMNAYFTQLADPEYRQAMQQQNLFSNLLNFGAQMSAAGAPSLDPGYAGRTRAGALAGLGKGLMSGNQDYRNQMMNAIKLKSMMEANKRAQAMHDVNLTLKKQEAAKREDWNKYLKTLQSPTVGGVPATPPLTEADYKEEFASGDSPEGATMVESPSALPTAKQTTTKAGIQFPPGFMAWETDKQQEWLGQYHSDQLDHNKDYTQGPSGIPQLTESGKVKIEHQFRKEFLAGTRVYREVRNSYARILAAIKDPSPAGDIALVFSYMKVLDPNSAVRETEYATAENAGNIPQRIRATWNKVFEGKGRLSVAQRQDFTTRATGLYNAQRDQYRNFREIYVNMAKGKGVGVEFAAPDIETPFPVIAIPKIGDIRLGAKGKRYELIGDTPSLQSSWKLVEE